MKRVGLLETGRRAGAGGGLSGSTPRRLSGGCSRGTGSRACRENHWQQFCFSWIPATCERGDFKPPISTDGGYGLFQLTSKPYDEKQVWDWAKNLDQAVEVMARKYETARAYLKRPDKPSFTPTAEMLFKDTLSLWNGGHYYKWVGKKLVPRYSAPEYKCKGPSSNVLLHNGVSQGSQGFCYVNRTDCSP